MRVTEISGEEDVVMLVVGIPVMYVEQPQWRGMELDKDGDAGVGGSHYNERIQKRQEMGDGKKYIYNVGKRMRW